jgi:amino acid adenylation domain-containing protein
VQLHEIFEATAREHPDRTAVEAPPRSERRERVRLSYAEVWAAAGDLVSAIGASRAGALGSSLPADARVAILLPRSSPELYVAQLAALRAGAAFLCLDPRFPDAQFRAVLEDARPLAIITDREGRARLEAIGSPLPPLIEVADVPPASDAVSDVVAGAVFEAGREADSRPDRDLAYLIYTSGTTGRPKGVMIEHRGIVELVESDRAHFGLGPEDRVAQLSSPAYDSSIEESWLAFAVGASLVLLDDETLRLGPDLPAWLRAEGITVLCPPPTLLRSMACEDPAAELPDLRLLYVGGEALPADLADLWAPGRRMVNGYGPTECTVTVLRAEVEAGRPVRIGYPVGGNRAWVLDAELRTLPSGEAGELCIQGPALARGYLDQPELSDRRFPEHPELGRIYRTGDLVRFDPAGGFEYLGRIDDQVKLRGYRIELGAVEAALASLPGLRAAACRLQGAGGRQLLAAHLVAEDPGRPPEIAAVLEGLRAALPDYMVPARLGYVERLPTSLGGKLDRRALPEIAAPATGAEAFALLGQLRVAMAGPVNSGTALSEAAANTEAAKTGTAISERAHNAEAQSELALTVPEPMLLGILAAFAEALELESAPDPAADFFMDLGGDSLAAVAAVLALRRAAASRPATVRDLYTARTARALAARLRESSEGSEEFSERTESTGSEASMTASLPSDAAVAGFTLLQALWLGLGLLLSSGLLWWLTFAVLPLLLTSVGLKAAILAAPFAWFVLRLLAIPIAVGWTAGLARLLVGRYQPGAIPLWSMAHWRHWAVVQAARAIPWDAMAGTPFGPLALRALGARIGRGVHLHRGVDWGAGAWNLIQIGDGATLGRDAAPLAVELLAGRLQVGRIEIGAGSSLGTRAGMSPGARIGACARLDSLSWLAGAAVLPACERWDGSPAAPAGREEEWGPALDARIARGASSHFPEHDPPDFGDDPNAGERSPAPREAWASGSLLLLARAAVGLPANLVLAILSLVALSVLGSDGARTVMDWLAAPGLSAGLVIWALALSSLALVFRLILQGLLVRGLSRGITAGSYRLSSPTAMRVQLAEDLVEAAGRWLSGSMLWPPWLRLAGMRIGRRCEISTIMECLPSLVEIDEECFFADGVYLAASRLHAGRMELGQTRIGGRTFLGNHCLLPGGHAWPAGLFLGVATRADAAIAVGESVDPGGGWFGHPAMALPAREVLDIDRRLTYEPSRGLWLWRAFWESLRLVLPALPWILSLLWYSLAARAEGALRPAAFFLLGLPALSLLCLALPCLAALALKWLLLGRVQPGQHAFWSRWCGRWDFCYMAWGAWARGILGALEGSLMLNAVLRASGMRIGRRVALGRGFAQVVDPDMLHFEDGASVACQFQAHSFEDRVLKIDRLRIGKDASVGQHTVVFYGAEIGAGARVAPHGVVMKRDRVAAGWYYAGSPSQPVARLLDRQP